MDVNFDANDQQNGYAFVPDTKQPYEPTMPPQPVDQDAKTSPPDGPTNFDKQEGEPSPNAFNLDALITRKQTAPDPFDPTRFRVPQSFATTGTVQKVHTTIPLRKPDKEWFVRTHPDLAYRMEAAVLELKGDDRDIYLVEPKLWGDLATEPTFGPRLLVAAVNRGGIPFIWPIKLPDPSGKTNNWNQSGLDAVEMAKDAWGRVTSNMTLGAYEVHVATGIVMAPAWPEIDFGRMIELAFRNKIIGSLDHPVLRKLRGEI